MLDISSLRVAHNTLPLIPSQTNFPCRAITAPLIGQLNIYYVYI